MELPHAVMSKCILLLYSIKDLFQGTQMSEMYEWWELWVPCMYTHIHMYKYIYTHVLCVQDLRHVDVMFFTCIWNGVFYICGTFDWKFKVPASTNPFCGFMISLFSLLTIQLANMLINVFEHSYRANTSKYNLDSYACDVIKTQCFFQYGRENC